MFKLAILIQGASSNVDEQKKPGKINKICFFLHGLDQKDYINPMIM